MHDDTPPSASAMPLPDGDSGNSAQVRERGSLGGIYVGPPLIRDALLNSFRDGIMANGMLALTDTFAVAAAIALRASSMGIALLSSLPLLLGSIGQFFLPALADPAQSRKRYIMWGVRGQILFLFLAGFAGWVPGGLAPWAYIALFVAASVSASLTGPFWVAWMGDLIPSAARGRIFAWRSMFFSWMYLSCSLTAGIISRRFGAENAPWLLFACVFTAAAALRSGSHFFMMRQYEPASSAQEAFSPLAFRPGRDFLLYSAAIGLYQGAASMSGPFFSVWYLRDLRFSYLFLSICLSLTVLGSIAFSGFWGRLTDTLGTGRVLWIAGFLAALVPFPYAFFQSKWIIWPCCFYSGATWGGYNLANFNHMLNATDSRHRSHYIAFSSLVIGVLGCAFSLLGGFLATRIPVFLAWRLQSLFLLSGILRLAIFAAFFGRFKEYRQALPNHASDLYMELPGFRMGAGLIRTVFRGFRGS